MARSVMLFQLSLLLAGIISSTDGVSVADLVTQQFFDSIKNKAAANPCPGKSFYTRQAFLHALESYPRFGRDGSDDGSKREVAAFFAHVTHETGYLCYKEEHDKSNAYCDTSKTQYPCAPGKKYYGRGPLQLTWNYNYAEAGRSIGFDGLRSPETVAKDATISFKTALWFWMHNVHRVMSQGFGATINKINSQECNGRRPDEMNARVRLYKQYCHDFHVAPGDHLTC